ncbi:MAG: ATP synthase F0 subunit B, partial [Duncaniella sp.]|nr:ATP synthase F0 subunit B [Duncaniella sp.]
MELFTPDFGLIFWMFVSFAILFFILWKWGWPAIMKGVSDRADLIDKGVEYAQNAKEQLDHAREEADKQIAEARRQQADMLREADRMKTQIIEEARTAAQAEAKKVMDAAK